MSLEQCTFSGNSPSSSPLLVAESNVIVYGDSSAPQVCTYSDFDPAARNEILTCAYSSARSLSEAGAPAGFLTGEDQWLLAAQQVCTLQPQL